MHLETKAKITQLSSMTHEILEAINLKTVFLYGGEEERV
jgi:hypothetical protein